MKSLKYAITLLLFLVVGAQPSPALPGLDFFFGKSKKTYLEVFESPGVSEFPVYDKPNPNPEVDRPILFLKPGDLLPEGKREGGAIKIERHGDAALGQLSPLYIPANFVRPTKEAEDRPLYLDGRVGTAFTLTNQPRKTYADCRAFSKDPDADLACKAWPTAGDDASGLQFTDSQLATFFDPVEGRVVTRIVYQTKGWYLPKRKTPQGSLYLDRNRKTFNNLWVDSKNIRYRPLGHKAELKICDPPPEQKQEQAVEKLAQKMNEDSPYLPLLATVGECQANEKKQGIAAIRARWAAKKASAQTVKLGSREVTASELEAIDIFARLIYGEMRSCAQSPQYLYGVGRVAMNRAEHVLKPGASTAIFPFPNPKPSADSSHAREEALIEVLQTPKQFSAINPGDPNLDAVMCPLRPTKAKEPNLALEAWKKSVHVAAMAVLDRKEFDEKTNKISVFHYTSNIAAPKSWGQPQRISASADNYDLDNQACIRLWKVEPAKRPAKPKEPGLTHKYGTRRRPK